MVRTLTIIVALGGLIYAYWCLFDRTLPISDVSSRLVALDSGHHWMDVEWTAMPGRQCDGTRLQEIDEPGDEPPARMRVSLPPVPLPPEDFRIIHEVGKPFTWKRRIQIPDDAPYPFVYKSEWKFHCNPAQTDVRSIYVKAPDLKVGF